MKENPIEELKTLIKARYNYKEIFEHISMWKNPESQKKAVSLLLRFRKATEKIDKKPQILFSRKLRRQLIRDFEIGELEDVTVKKPKLKTVFTV